MIGERLPLLPQGILLAPCGIMHITLIKQALIIMIKIELLIPLSNHLYNKY